MSLDKAINSGKEKRKSYRKSKAVDRTCCNHGSCSWCKNNRLYASKKTLEGAEDQVDEFFETAITDPILTEQESRWEIDSMISDFKNENE